MDNQPTIEQLYAIFVTTLDYLLELFAPRVIIDQHDMTREYYDKLRQRADINARMM